MEDNEQNKNTAKDLHFDSGQKTQNMLHHHSQSDKAGHCSTVSLFLSLGAFRKH